MSLLGLILEKEFHAIVKPAVKSALPAEEQNLIVYTGFVFFVGAGIDMDGWSFTVDISKPPEHQEGAVAPVPFKVEELYAMITVRLLSLNLDGLVVKDIFFVNGREIKDDRGNTAGIYLRSSHPATPFSPGKPIM